MAEDKTPQTDTPESGDTGQPGSQLAVPPETQRGAYANQALIANTAEEFILDFIMASPPTAH